MSAIHELIVSAFMPEAIRAEWWKREMDHHWPLPVPKDCVCQKENER